MKHIGVVTRQKFQNLWRDEAPYNAHKFDDQFTSNLEEQ